MPCQIAPRRRWAMRAQGRRSPPCARISWCQMGGSRKLRRLGYFTLLLLNMIIISIIIDCYYGLSYCWYYYYCCFCYYHFCYRLALSVSLLFLLRCVLLVPKFTGHEAFGEKSFLLCGAEMSINDHQGKKVFIASPGEEDMSVISMM